MPDIGDFSVPSFALQSARKKQDGRSERAKAQDRQKRARVTTDLNKWGNNPDKYDYPGIDTPSENPDLLPKDLKQTDRPSTSARASGQAPSDTMQLSGEELAEETFTAQATDADVSLAPDEDLRGVAATSSRELGGFNSTTGGERAPLNTQTEEEFGIVPLQERDDGRI